MATLNLSVPDDLLRRVRARLGNNEGQAGVEEYLLCVLEALAMEGQPIDGGTEGKLLEGMNSPLREVSPADWESKLRRYDARHR